MQTFRALDQVIQSVCQTGTFMWKSTSVLFSYNPRFRDALSAGLEGVVEREHRVVRFDVENRHVEVPDAGRLPETRSVDFDFDFGHFARFQPPISLAGGEITFAEAAFPAVQGHFRAVTWNMCLSPSGLLDLCGFYRSHAGEVIDVGTHPTAAVLDGSPTAPSSSSRSSSESREDHYSSDDEPSSAQSARRGSGQDKGLTRYAPSSIEREGSHIWFNGGILLCGMFQLIPEHM